MTRLRRLVVSAVFVVLTVPAAASEVVTFEALTIAATAVGLATTTTSPTGERQIRQCSGRLATAQVRYRWDGTDPVAGTGTLLEIGDVVEIGSHEDAVAIRFIRTGATSGVLSIHCWR